MNLAELYAQIEAGELDPDVSDEILTFYCTAQDYGVLAEPRPAATHYADEQRNYTDPRTLRVDARPHTDTAAVEAAMQAGWIIPFPAELYLNATVTDSPGVPAHDFPNYLSDYGKPTGNSRTNVPFLVHTKWVIDLPPDYSLLVMHPPNYGEERFSTVPRIIDAGEFPQWLSIPVIPHATDTVIAAGTPLAHALPIPHDDYEASATVGAFTSEEAPEHLTHPLTES